MSPHISMITLGVPDVAKATAFYERLGFAKSSASQEAVTFFKAGSVVLGLFGRDALQEDAAAGNLWTGNGGTAVAANYASEAEVDAMMHSIVPQQVAAVRAHARARPCTSACVPL